MMVLRPKPKPNVLWTPLPKQKLALECPVDDILFGGAVGGGKTDLVLAAWVQHAATYGEHASGLIARHTIPELREILKRSKRLFPRLGAEWKSQERTWTFPNGAVLLLGYLETLDDAEKYQGQEFTFVGIDEAGKFKESEPIDYIRSRMRSPIVGIRKQLILTANPGGAGQTWLKKRYIEGHKPYVPFADPETGLYRVYIPSRLVDNPYLMADPEYIQRIKASGPSWLVKALLLGDWDVSVQGKIFMREWWHRYAQAPRKQDIAHILQVWDTASKTKTHNDRSVCETWGIVPGQGAYLLDAWAGKLTFPALKAKVVELATLWECWDVRIEDTSAGTAIIQSLQEETDLAISPAGPTGADWLYTGALAASSMIERGLVLIPTNAPWLDDFLDEHAQYPQGAHDDYVAATVHSLNHIGKTFALSAGASQFDYRSITKRPGSAGPADAGSYINHSESESEAEAWL